MPAGRVTVRVWSPKRSLGSPLLKSVGHISLQTYRGGPENKGHYVSMYPEKKASFFSPRFPRRLVSGVYTDKIKLPENEYSYKEIDLFSLDVERINAAYERFKVSNCDWSLFANFKLGQISMQNCSGLVYNLLKEGCNPKVRHFFLLRGGAFDHNSLKNIGVIAGMVGLYAAVVKNYGLSVTSYFLGPRLSRFIHYIYQPFVICASMAVLVDGFIALSFVFPKEFGNILSRLESSEEEIQAKSAWRQAEAERRRAREHPAAQIQGGIFYRAFRRIGRAAVDHIFRP